MACTYETFLKIVEYQKKNPKTSFMKARRAVREEMTDEEVKEENDKLICCAHYRVKYDETKEVGQCDDCVQEHGFRYMSDPKHGVIGSKPYWVVRRQKYKVEDAFDFEDDENGEPKPKKKRTRRKKSKIVDAEAIEKAAKKKRGRPKKKK